MLDSSLLFLLMAGKLVGMIQVFMGNFYENILADQPFRRFGNHSKGFGWSVCDQYKY